MNRPARVLAAVAVAAPVALGACSSAKPAETVTVTTPPAVSQAPTSPAAATPNDGIASATPSLTPETATPDADASTSPDAASSAASPRAIKTGVAPSTSAQLSERYCTAAQKLCFAYPQGFRIASTPLPQGMPGESGQLLDPEGKPVLHFADGITGLGGMCGDPGKSANTVVAVRPGQAHGLEERDGMTVPDAFVVHVVVPGREGGYVANEYLSNTTRYAKPGEVQDCREFYSDIIPVGGASVHLGIHPFSSPEVSQSYATVDEARAQFTTQRYELVSKILESATIG